MELAPYMPPGECLGACSRCLIDRIEGLRRKDVSLPDWVLILEREARTQVALEIRKSANEVALDFDDFCKCIRCGKLIHQKDTRYSSQAADKHVGISPHCLDCYASVVSG
jgi:hypothetical protein